MKSIKVLALGIAIMLLGTSFIYAQGVGVTTGTITGEVKDEKGSPLPGVLVTVTGQTGSKTVTTDESGKFLFPYLTPGTYDVRAELESYTTIEQSGVEVRLNQRTEVAFKMNPGQAEMVVVTGESPVVDVSSTTTGANLTNEVLQSLPIGRGFTSAISLAPGVADAGVGGANLSISGASGLENTYLVDGVNITDPGYGAVGAYSINFGSLGSGFTQDMVKEIQVKTGGFEPEYGQALGGVVNVITKSGGNEYSGEGYAYFAPGALEGDRDQLNLPSSFISNFSDTENIDGGVNAGGPIIKDKLFFFGSYNPRRNEVQINSDVDAPAHDAFPSSIRKRTTHSYSGKITANATANHSFEFSAFGDPSKGAFGFHDEDRMNTLNPELQRSDLEYGTDSQIGRWTGILRQNMFVEAQFARNHNKFIENIPDESNAYQISDRHSQVDPVTGLVVRFNKGGIGFFENSEGENMQYSAKATNIFAGHELRYGVQFEDITYSGGANYTGPHFESVFGPTTTGAILLEYTGEQRGLTAPLVWIVSRDRLNPRPIHTSTEYLNWFVQDSWNITSYFNVKAGIRWERQRIKGDDASIVPGSDTPIPPEDIKLTNNWAPRLGGTFDYLKNGKSKVYAHWGRFYEKIPNDLAVRSLVSEVSTSGYYYSIVPTVSDPVPDTAAVSGGSPTVFEGRGSDDSPYKSKSQYSDEFLVGMEQEVAPTFSLGGRFLYRKVGRVLEDTQVDTTAPCVPYTAVDSSLCVPPGMVAEPGFFLSHSSYYFITNVDGHYPGYPNLKRDYKAIEITAEKRFSNRWQMLANYRYARLEGNYEGLFRRDNGQSDPNISSLGDFAACLANPDGSCTRSEFLGFTYTEGDLPNDQRNIFRVFSSYQWDMGLTLGGGFTLNTGNPISNLGAIPFYGSRERVLEPRGSRGRTDTITSLDVHADYAWRIGGGDQQLTFGIDVFNIANSQSALYVTPNSQIDNRSYEPDPNPDFLLPTQFQDPRQVRFLVKYSF
jgi:Carboxypeptidase regulatory-like domain/TonB-dependent Receptor Plug Domain